MATTYGLTLAGLVIKTLSVIRAELDTAVRGALGASVPLGDRTLLGFYDGTLADREAAIWQLIQVIYASTDPDQATGAALDALCLLTGTTRTPASKSTTTLTLCGTASTVVAAGSQVKTTSTGKVFATTDNVTLTAVSAWVSMTPYVAGNWVMRVMTGVNTIFSCILAVTSASAPETDPTHWQQVGTGLAVATVTALSVDAGPITATAGDITTIVTGVGGWSSVFNQLDAVLGRNQATDEELRLLRQAELAAPGTSPVDAIRADVLTVTGVTTCGVFENVTDATDANGMPPHSVEVLVQGGADQDIRDRLLGSVAAGIATTGNVPSGTSTDSQGIVHTIAFSRPTAVPIYVDVAITKDPLKYPADGDTQIKTAITTMGAAQSTGKDAVSSAVIAACFTIAGVLDVTHAYIGTAPAPGTPTTVAIDLRSLATWDSTRITVTSINGTP